jgi:predicted DNA-binding protein with PD1-like motif
MVGLGAYHASGRMGRVVPLRLRRGTDLMNGLKKVCEESGITQGAILGASAACRR